MPYDEDTLNDLHNRITRGRQNMGIKKTTVTAWNGFKPGDVIVKREPAEYGDWIVEREVEPTWQPWEQGKFTPGSKVRLTHPDGSKVECKLRYPNHPETAFNKLFGAAYFADAVEQGWTVEVFA
jgi:hypothetical protein